MERTTIEACIEIEEEDVEPARRVLNERLSLGLDDGFTQSLAACVHRARGRIAKMQNLIARCIGREVRNDVVVKKRREE